MITIIVWLEILNSSLINIFYCLVILIILNFDNKYTNFMKPQSIDNKLYSLKF